MSQILVELQEHMGSDRSIAEAAWTSSTTRQGKERKTDEQVADLVRRLATEGHATPFETVVLRFWMRIPIFIDRQIVTHRIASHSGMSGRYRTMPKDWFGLPADVASILDKAFLDHLVINYRHACEIASKGYVADMRLLREERDNGLISNDEYKRVREILRGMLPQAAMTERVSTFNLRSFANFQRLRNSDYAQPEITEVARLMLDAVKSAGICPVAIEALEEQGWRI
jgi:thymidylate synthase (FAD)